MVDKKDSIADYNWVTTVYSYSPSTIPVNVNFTDLEWSKLLKITPVYFKMITNLEEEECLN